MESSSFVEGDTQSEAVPPRTRRRSFPLNLVPVLAALAPATAPKGDLSKGLGGSFRLHARPHRPGSEPAGFALVNDC